MAANIQVDYLGNGVMSDAFHPVAKIANIMGKIALPNINLEMFTMYEYAFTLPTPITNPFMFVHNLIGGAYVFSPVNESAGTWKLRIMGYIIINQNGQEMAGYVNPVTNKNSVQSYIYYGGFRG